MDYVHAMISDCSGKEWIKTDPILRKKAIEILKNMAEKGKVDMQLVEWLDEALG